MDNPLVSIVVNNYNYARFLPEAIESALRQTYSNCEVVVVDDGSTDNSQEIIRSYGKRLIAVFQANGGQASAMNTGYRNATGEYVLFLDADDVLEPNCVEQCLKHLTPGVSRLVYDMLRIDAKSRPMPRLSRAGKLSLEGSRVDLARGILQSVAGAPTSSNFFPRRTLEQLLPIEPASRFRICADQFLLMKSAVIGPVKVIGLQLARYRIHDNNSFSARRVTEKSIRVRLNNFNNRNYIKSDIFKRPAHEWNPGEYINGWEDYEAIFLARKHGGFEKELHEVDLRLVDDSLKRQCEEAIKGRRAKRVLMLGFARFIRLVPLRVALGLSRLVRVFKYS